MANLFPIDLHALFHVAKIPRRLCRVCHLHVVVEPEVYRADRRLSLFSGHPEGDTFVHFDCEKDDEIRSFCGEAIVPEPKKFYCLTHPEVEVGERRRCSECGGVVGLVLEV